MYKKIILSSIFVFSFIPSFAETHKTPVIMDTDMGFDDWLAIVYVVKNPSINVKAITVDCVGETSCKTGANNATKLVRLATNGKKEIPVFTYQKTAGLIGYNFDFRYPNFISSIASNMQVKDFDDLKGYPYNKEISPGEAIYDIASTSDEPISILSTGTATNISEAIEIANKKNNLEGFKKGIKRVYKGGGAFGELNEIGELTNKNQPGNIPMNPIFESNNSESEWNIYPNALAMQRLLSSNIPITFLPLNMTDDAKITKKSYNIFSNGDTSKSKKFVLQAITDVIESLGGWDIAKLEYWDPAVVVAALNPSLITNQFYNQSICIQLAGAEHTVNVNDEGELVSLKFNYLSPLNEKYQYAATLVNLPINKNGSLVCDQFGLPSNNANIIYKIDIDGFYEEFSKYI